MKSSKPNRSDIVVYAVIAIFAAALLFFFLRPVQETVLTAEIRENGVMTAAYRLSEIPESGLTLTLNGEGYTIAVLLEQDGVRVTEADCPGRDCIKTGKIRRAGRSIVCLPGRISITLTGSSGSDIDLIVG